MPMTPLSQALDDRAILLVVLRSVGEMADAYDMKREDPDRWKWFVNKAANAGLAVDCTNCAGLGDLAYFPRPASWFGPAESDECAPNCGLHGRHFYLECPGCLGQGVVFP